MADHLGAGCIDCYRGCLRQARTGATIYQEPTYGKYLQSLLDQGVRQISAPDVKVSVLAVDFHAVSDQNRFSVKDEFLYWHADDGWVEYQVVVEQPGLYNIVVEYMPLETQMFNIERGIMIDGEYPFREAGGWHLTVNGAIIPIPLKGMILIMNGVHFKSRLSRFKKWPWRISTAGTNCRFNGTFLKALIQSPLPGSAPR